MPTQVVMPDGFREWIAPLAQALQAIPSLDAVLNMLKQPQNAKAAAVVPTASVAAVKGRTNS